MTSKPVNCPFCGSEANFIDVDRDDYIYIMCKDGENCMANMGPHYTKEAAIKAWNTRTPEDKYCNCQPTVSTGLNCGACGKLLR